MVDVEARASENVIKACARTPSVKKCVFTSSLLACLWQDRAQNENNSYVINHDCWSDESVCIDKKVTFFSPSLCSFNFTARFMQPENDYY